MWHAKINNDLQNHMLKPLFLLGPLPSMYAKSHWCCIYYMCQTNLLTTLVRLLDIATSISSRLLSLGEPNTSIGSSSSCSRPFRPLATAWIARIHSSLRSKNHSHTSCHTMFCKFETLLQREGGVSENGIRVAISETCCLQPRIICLALLLSHKPQNSGRFHGGSFKSEKLISTFAFIRYVVLKYIFQTNFKPLQDYFILYYY